MSGLALSLFLAVKRGTNAGSGRIILPREAMEKTSLRLGDPAFIDVSLPAVKPSALQDERSSLGWTFLVIVEPALEQYVCLPVGSFFPGSETAVFDPLIQVARTNSSKLPQASEMSVPSLQGRLRKIRQKPIECSALLLSVCRLNQSSVSLTAISRLLQYCYIIPGASITLAKEFVAIVLAAYPPVQSSEIGSEIDQCWYITANTRITITDDLEDKRANHELFSRGRPLYDGHLAGMDDALASLREVVIWPYLHPNDASRLGFEFPRGLLIHGPPGVGKSAAVRMVTAELNAKERALGGGDVFGPFAGDSEAKLRHLFQAAKDDIKNGTPTILMLDEIDTICPARGSRMDLHGSRVVGQLLTLMDDGGHVEQDGRRCPDGSKNTPKNVTFPSVIATTNRPNVVDSALRRPGRFDMEIEMMLPCKQQRELILKLHSRSFSLASDVDLHDIAEQAKGYSGADLAALCREAAMNAIRRTNTMPDVRSSCEITHRAGGISASLVSCADFKLAAANTCASLVRGVKIELPNANWDAVGGLDEIKYHLQKAVEWPLRHSLSFSRLGLKSPRGILLCGPPGCAKTTLAHAVATATRATVIILTVADIFNKLVGKAEQALRDAFARARRAAPSILLLDELDGMLSSRNSSAISNDTSKGAHVLSVLLTEMDGLDVTSDGAVIVIGTTNRPRSLDHALTRPGRFDVVLHVSRPDAIGRAEALRIHSRDTPLDDDVNLDDIAMQTEHFTGAQIEGIVREATLVALREDINNKHVAQRHFEAALMATL